MVDRDINRVPPPTAFNTVNFTTRFFWHYFPVHWHVGLTVFYCTYLLLTRIFFFVEFHRSRKGSLQSPTKLPDDCWGLDHFQKLATIDPCPSPWTVNYFQGDFQPHYGQILKLFMTNLFLFLSAEGSEWMNWGPWSRMMTIEKPKSRWSWGRKIRWRGCKTFKKEGSVSG